MKCLHIVEVARTLRILEARLLLFLLFCISALRLVLNRTRVGAGATVVKNVFGNLDLRLWRFQVKANVKGLHHTWLHLSRVESLLDIRLLSNKELRLVKLCLSISELPRVVIVHLNHLFLKGLLKSLNFLLVLLLEFGDSLRIWLDVFAGYKFNVVDQRD